MSFHSLTEQLNVGIGHRARDAGRRNCACHWQDWLPVSLRLLLPVRPVSTVAAEGTVQYSTGLQVGVRPRLLPSRVRGFRRERAPAC